MNEPVRTLAWVCPACRQSVIVDRSVFALSAAPSRLPCPCGKSAVTVEPEEERFRLTAPCVRCGGEHTVLCAREAFLRRRALAFSCAASGLDCLCVGEEEPVRAAVRGMEETADLLPGAEEEGAPSAFLNPAVMEEVLGEIRDIARRPGGICCTCGSERWRMRVGYSAVVLTCDGCGASLRLPAATASQLDELCCKTRLVIQGRDA